jgi:hypothetical protein
MSGTHLAKVDVVGSIPITRSTVTSRLYSPFRTVWIGYCASWAGMSCWAAWMTAQAGAAMGASVMVQRRA